MAWVDNLNALAAAVVDPAAFGEAVRLPSGQEVAGVFDPIGTPAADFGSAAGVLGRVSAQANPEVHLRTALAMGLTEGATLIIRGAPYQITRLDPDGGGLTRCLLMPAGVSGSDGLARYR